MTLTDGQAASTGGSRAMAIWSLVLGIVTVVLAFIPVVNMVSWVAAVVGLVLGIIALVRKLAGRRTAITGTALSGAAILLSIVMTIVYIVAGSLWAVAWFGGSYLEQVEQSPATTSPAATPSGDGTEQSPFALGAPFEVPRSAGGSWTVTIDSAQLDANDEIDNPYADQLPADEVPQYALLEVTVEYNGTDTSRVPVTELQFGYQPPTGDMLWGSPSREVTTPNSSFAELDMMEPGESATVDVVVPVLPAGASADDAETVADGLWAVMSPLGDDTFYVSLR